MSMSEIKMSITTVRIKVAKLESMPVTPIFPKMAVNAAKKAERRAKIFQLPIII